MVLFFVDYLEAGDYGAAEPYSPQQKEQRPEEQAYQQDGKPGDHSTDHAKNSLGHQCLLGMLGDESILLILNQIQYQRNHYLANAEEQVGDVSRERQHFLFAIYHE